MAMTYTVTCAIDNRIGDAESPDGPPNVARDCIASPSHQICDIHVEFEHGHATCAKCKRDREARGNG